MPCLPPRFRGCGIVGMALARILLTRHAIWRRADWKHVSWLQSCRTKHPRIRPRGLSRVWSPLLRQRTSETTSPASHSLCAAQSGTAANNRVVLACSSHDHSVERMYCGLPYHCNLTTPEPDVSEQRQGMMTLAARRSESTRTRTTTCRGPLLALVSSHTRNSKRTTTGRRMDTSGSKGSFAAECILRESPKPAAAVRLLGSGC